MNIIEKCCDNGKVIKLKIVKELIKIHLKDLK